MPPPDTKPTGEAYRPIRSDESKLQSSLIDELTLGRKKLIAAFGALPATTVKSGQSLASFARYRRAIFRLRAGWTCQFRDLCNGRGAIIDVYLPGDVIGLDTFLRTQRLDGFLTLTSVKLDVIPAEDKLFDLLTDPCIALYLLWLLGQRQRRTDRRLAAFAGHEAQVRLALMVLDFYTRLRSRSLITGLSYNLPMTQLQIGNYLGLTSVHVNRVLRSLRDEHVINLEKNCVTIFDLERLTRLAHGEDLVKSAATLAITAEKSLSRPHQAAE